MSSYYREDDHGRLMTMMYFLQKLSIIEGHVVMTGGPGPKTHSRVVTVKIKGEVFGDKTLVGFFKGTNVKTN